MVHRANNCGGISLQHRGKKDPSSENCIDLVPRQTFGKHSSPVMNHNPLQSRPQHHLIHPREVVLPLHDENLAHAPKSAKLSMDGWNFRHGCFKLCIDPQWRGWVISAVKHMARDTHLGMIDRLNCSSTTSLPSYCCNSCSWPEHSKVLLGQSRVLQSGPAMLPGADNSA